jgi:DNA polymerase I-like protein with 3'-5' exonuclease and polymerase domains
MIGRIESPETLPPADRDKAFGQALQRGEYMKALASMERRGVPIDVPELTTLRSCWRDIELELIARVDRDYGIYDGEHFNLAAFGAYLNRNGIVWPRTPTGRLSLDKDVFKEMAVTYPALAPLHELRASLSQMRDFKLAVGQDGRNRCILADLDNEKPHRGFSPYGAKTSRNTPSNSEFIFGAATWLRSLIRPEPGTALAYLDYEQQEFGVAACLSGDRNMMDAYTSGDPYLAFAVQAGAAPDGATKETHGAVRDQFKTCALGIQYAMGAEALAQRLGVMSSRGRELLRLHHDTYPDYWRWSEACVSCAMLHGHLTATYGWCVHVGPDTRPTSLRNFLLQANGAEMLRLACILATERGLPVCCPVHDALLIEAPTRCVKAVVAETQEVMRKASELVLPGFPLRTEAKVFYWPERFTDKRGRRMWETVQGLMGGTKAAPVRICHRCPNGRTPVS